MRAANEANCKVTRTFKRVTHSLFSKSILATAACLLASGLAQAQVDNTVGNFAGSAIGGWSGSSGTSSPVVGPPDGSCSNIGNVGSDNSTFQYGFNIPGDATITDINFFIKASAGQDPEDLEAQLASDASVLPVVLIGTPNTIEIGTGNPNCASTFIQNFNFSLADWGTNSTEVTPAVVNDPGFGINFVTLESSSIKVDANCLEIDYITDSGPATQVGCFTVQFTVNKDFSDDNPAEVDITLACDGADDITANPLTASEGNPAVFSVLDIDGGATCTATETSGLPAGYDKDESDCQQQDLPADGGECTIVNTAVSPSMQVTKTVDNAGTGDGGNFQAGDTIEYTIEATNDGNVTLNNVVVSDTLLFGMTDQSCAATLAPTESCSVTGSYTVTQDDIDNNGGGVVGDGDGDIDNIATADSDESGPQTASAEAQLVTQDPSMAVNKTITNTGSATDDSFNEGDPINYSIEVTNDGNVTLTNVVVSDELLFGMTEQTCAAELLPGASCTVTGSYTVTQNDIDTNGGGDGDIDNTASATSDETGTQTANAEAPLNVAPDMTTTKTVDNAGTGDGGNFQAGDTIEYTIEVTNDGTVTLDNVVVTDPLLGLTDQSCSTALAPQDSCQVTGSYTVTQADIDDNGDGDGDIDNTATADSDTTGPESASAEAQLVTQDASIAATKTVDNTGSGTEGRFEAGDTIEYTIEVTNDGNVTLTNVVVSDPLLFMADQACAAELLPGASCSVTGSYTVTQGDIDDNGGGDGDIDNTATADSDESGPQTVTAAAQLVTQDPDITIVKTADPATYEMSGDVITYTFLVTNTGNVTLFNITITDPLITEPPNSETINCPSGHPIPSLEAGASESCTATYTVTEDDVLNGEVTNLATVAADCSEPVEGVTEPCTGNEDSETVEGEGQTTTFRVQKDFSDDNPQGVTVSIECNTGLPLEQSAVIHDPDAAGLEPGDFTHVEFVVVDFEPGTMDCDIDEEIPAGYLPNYSADVTDGEADSVFGDEEGCHYEGITMGGFTCDIFNALQPVDVVVEKEWIDENPEFLLPLSVAIDFFCDGDIVGVQGCSDPESDAEDCTGLFIDPDNPGEFQVLPHFEGTECWATEDPISGVLADESDCESMIVTPGQGASCVIVNTRLFEGIPTLSQYALMLMALLMLGFGAVAYRRFV